MTKEDIYAWVPEEVGKIPDEYFASVFTMVKNMEDSKIGAGHDDIKKEEL